MATQHGDACAAATGAQAGVTPQDKVCCLGVVPNSHQYSLYMNITSDMDVGWHFAVFLCSLVEMHLAATSRLKMCPKVAFQKR